MPRYSILLTLVLLLATTSAVSARDVGKITLDGRRVRVMWNDGDSFRILGRFGRRGKARLAGYNTLENFGPVHRWGKWNAWKLYRVGDRATRVAASRRWRCRTLPGGGGYGRMLVYCPGLARTLVRKGLAHVYSVKGPGRKRLIKIQKVAQKKRRGIWKRGVPRYIMTSVRSAPGRGYRRPYVRMISSKNGASRMIRHSRVFEMCQWVCHGGSCMLYVPFRRRYRNKAACLYKGGKTKGVVKLSAKPKKRSKRKKALGIGDDDNSRKEGRVKLDGKVLHVWWSDGDTFKIIGMKGRRARARMKGYNTLENYGPVHRWGKWKAIGLFRLTNRATGICVSRVWRCRTLKGSGGYGRRLVSCPKLARTLIRKGLAHVFSMKKRGNRRWLRLQRKAQKKRRGIWKKGVPSHIVTSVHAARSIKRSSYDRLISTKTGGSTRVRHKKNYKICQWVCRKGSCMRYVPYRRRYRRKASCLKVK